MHATRVDPADARQTATDILHDRRYRRDAAPRPLRRPLEWLGDRLHDIGDAITRVFRAVPGPTWLAITIVIIGVVFAFITWLVRAQRTTGASASAGHGRGATSTREDPATLERAADDAERAGDL